MTTVIAVTGGKGGTGKTLLAVNLAYILSRNDKTLLVDADVDNPCSKTFLKTSPNFRKIVKEFRPRINQDKCKLCGTCVQNCHEHALLLIPGKRVTLMPELCEGCGVCKIVCPFDAIEDSWIDSGCIEEYQVSENLDAIVGELKPTTKRTPVMILKTLKHAEERMNNYRYVVVDSPPGTGSGIYAVMRFSEKILAVTEPTRLGLTDLMKLYRLYKQVKPERKLLVVVNKSGIRGELREELEETLSNLKVEWRKIPYDESAVKSYVEGSILVERFPDTPSAQAITRIAREIFEGS